jgi:D-alanyl-D-alanine dipeptidase
MLNQANDALPTGYRYAVSTALRTLEMQSNMYWHNYNRLKSEKPHLPTSALRRITNKYFAAPDYPAPPGHTTGGAIDVSLLGPDFSTQDVTSPTKGWEAAYTWSDLIGPEAKKNRMIVVETLLSVGFSNCRDEWWHYSYGDNAWAVRHGCAIAMYGLIAPPEGYTHVARPEPHFPRRVGYRTHGPRVIARR